MIEEGARDRVRGRQVISTEREQLKEVVWQKYYRLSTIHTVKAYFKYVFKTGNVSKIKFILKISKVKQIMATRGKNQCKRN